MSLFRSFPNSFGAAIGSTSTSGSTGVLLSTGALDFGFQAALTKIAIDASGPAYLRLDGTVATTSDFPLSTGDGLVDFYDIGAGLSGISLAATSTGMRARVGAWG